MWRLTKGVRADSPALGRWLTTNREIMDYPNQNTFSNAHSYKIQFAPYHANGFHGRYATTIFFKLHLVSPFSPINRFTAFSEIIVVNYLQVHNSSSECTTGSINNIRDQFIS